MTGVGKQTVPRAIEAFRWCFPAAIVAGIVVTAQRWTVISDNLLRAPATARLWWLLPVMAVAGVLFQLLLLWLVLARRSTAARWLIAALALFEGIRLLLRFRDVLAQGGAGGGATYAVAALLAIAAAALLFTRDGAAWFGRPAPTEEDR